MSKEPPAQAGGFYNHATLGLAPGTRLGPYEVVAPIGAGGMGEVYRARDTRLDRDVAIKVLPESFAVDADRVARFTREAKTLASLNHPNIAQIYGIEEHGSTRALAMELVPGEDLSAHIVRGPIALADALPIARQIADALEAAHEQGIIHRDLKPANIKVRADGTVKVLDFGLAKAMEVAGASSPSASVLANSPTLTSPAMTAMGMILGTAAYMAPEQARGKAVDKRADIWAFGAVLFEMLSGKPAFPGDDISHVLARVIECDPDWSVLPESLPAPLAMCLRRCLVKDPRERMRDIGDVRLALAGAFDTPAAPTAAPPPAARPVWSIAAAGLAGFAIAAALFAVVYFRRPAAQADHLVRFSISLPAEGTPSGLFAIAPDGRTIAFAAPGADRVRRIYVRQTDSADAQPLAGTEGGNAPFWSPDSRSLGFVREDVLYRVDLGSSSARRLCDIPGTGSGVGTTSGTWNANGVIVFSTRSRLYRVADTGGTPAPLTTLDAAANEVQHAGPWFLPDGRHLLFQARASGYATGPIWAISIDAPSERTRVVESAGPAAYAAGWLFYTTEDAGRTVVAQSFDIGALTVRGTPQPVRDGLPGATTASLPGFAVSATGTLVVHRPRPLISQLTWVDRTGQAVGSVGPRASVEDFALAPDERRIVADLRDPNTRRTDLWLFDGVREQGMRLTYQERSARPLWAHDGRQIYFRTGRPDLRTITIGAAASSPFENPGSFNRFEDVTRDGRYLVLRSASQEIWIQPAGGGERRMLLPGAYVPSQARVSPDGRWLAYTLQFPTGPEVFVQPFDRSGDRIDVGKGFGPMWRDDGRELYYETADGLVVVVAMAARGDTLESGPPQTLFSVRTQGFVSGQPRNVEAAAHGQKFLVNAIVGDSDDQPLEVTLNWTAGLRK